MEEKLYIKGSVKEVKQNGVITGAVASTGILDRDEEIIEPDGWVLDNFKLAPQLLWSHDSRLLPIGKVTKIDVMNGKLIFDAEFAVKDEFAKRVSDLMSDGFLSAFSVGFKPLKKEENRFVEQELLEISVVNVPANPEARDSREYKNFMADIEKEFKIEESETTIRIPVRNCAVTATIDINRTKGIKGLLCGKINKIKTYIFDKSKGWTISSAQKWVKDHDEKSYHYLVEKMPESLPEETKNHLRIVKSSCEELLKVKSKKGSSIPKVEKRTAESKKVAKTKKAVRIIAQATEVALRTLKEK
ncbi:MAG: HK97 family phage prohead protease [Bacteroidetes bacterium]|nr:HK97 family phage prohead protease [Bacteroidota bacterium]